MTIHFAGQDIGTLEVVIVYLLLALVFALGLYGGLNLVARLNEKVKRGSLSPIIATSAGLLLAVAMACAVAILPATLITNIEAYDSLIGVLVFFGAMALAIVVVLVDFSKK